MRIGIDVRLWNESGVGRYTKNLIAQLQKIDKINTYVLFSTPQDYQKIKSQILNSNNWEIVGVNFRWHSLSEQKDFPSILKKQNLDLVHFPYFSVPIYYNKPFVITIHDLIINHFSTGKASTLFPLLYKIKLLGYKYVISKAAKKAKKIITVSNATKDEITRHLDVDPSKIIVTYEGIDQNLKLNTSKNLQLKNKDYFLYVGNAYPHKNLEILLKAFGILISGNHKDVSLILVGKEDYFYKKLKEKVKKMKLSNIEFFGEAKDEELSALYRNAKAIVLPSLMEGFGLPALEAMANKCLVLCSDIPAFKEICMEFALYFNSTSVQNLSEQMEKIISGTNDYNDLKQKAFERSKDFSWEKMARKTLEIYESRAGLRQN